jgi:hypothetical protein
MTDKPDPRTYMTTVKELIEILSDLPDDSVVVLQRDSEGNGYSPLAGGEAAKYRPENTYSGEVPCQEDIEGGEYEEEDVAKMLDCVVLWPIN